MILVFTHQITNRVIYTLDLLLKQLLGLEYELTTNKEEFTTSELSKFSYTHTALGNELFFESASLLFETSLHEIKIVPINSLVEEIKLTGYFETKNCSTFPFDMFASAFLLVSRYEEYLAYQKDEHHRFHATKSWAYRDGFLNSPMVNYYALAIQHILGKLFPVLKFNKTSFEYISTIDVDMAYSYLYKGFKRNIGGAFKDFVNARYGQIVTRIKVLIQHEKDPFDTFEYLQSIQVKYGFKNIFFFLLANHSKHDKNTPHTLLPFRDLIQKISSVHETGIHFSYQSHHKKNGYEIEKLRLSEITHHPTIQNRFHFLKFDIANTYAKILAIGIKSDYSMGYASHNGFRASIANPFYFFDLNNNQPTELKIYPFMYMDATLQYYQKMSIEKAKKEIQELIKTTQLVGGNFISIWHNNSLCEQAEWRGWRELYEYTHEQALLLSKKETTLA